MKKIVKAVLGFLSLLTAGCDNCKHCSCGHHDHHDAVVWKKDSIYKIVPQSNFDKSKADDCVVLLPLDQQSGFIHAGYGRQVNNIIKKFFSDAKELVVLELDPEVLKANGIELRVESNKPGGDVFPHLYGTQKIQLSAIKEVKALKKDEHGDWEENK